MAVSGTPPYNAARNASSVERPQNPLQAVAPSVENEVAAELQAVTEPSANRGSPVDVTLVDTVATTQCRPFLASSRDSILSTKRMSKPNKPAAAKTKVPLTVLADKEAKETMESTIFYIATKLTKDLHITVVLPEDKEAVVKQLVVSLINTYTQPKLFGKSADISLAAAEGNDFNSPHVGSIDLERVGLSDLPVLDNKTQKDLWKNITGSEQKLAKAKTEIMAYLPRFVDRNSGVERQSGGLTQTWNMQFTQKVTDTNFRVSKTGGTDSISQVEDAREAKIVKKKNGTGMNNHVSNSGILTRANEDGTVKVAASRSGKPNSPEKVQEILLTNALKELEIKGGPGDDGKLTASKVGLTSFMDNMAIGGFKGDEVE